MRQGCFFFHYSLATLTTNWDQIFTGLLFCAYVETHQVRRLVYDNYRRCPVSLKILPVIKTIFNFKNILWFGVKQRNWLEWDWNQLPLDLHWRLYIFLCCFIHVFVVYFSGKHFLVSSRCTSSRSKMTSISELVIQDPQLARTYQRLSIILCGLGNLKPR